MNFTIDELGDKDLISSIERFHEVSEIIERNTQLIANGLGFTAESPQRLKEYIKQHRIATENDVATIERQIGAINNILSIEFLELGLLAAKSVGRLINGIYTGTGFLVGDNILMTNNHIINSAEDAKQWQFDLNAEDNRFGPPQMQYSYTLDPDRFFLTNKEFDFTLVAARNSSGQPPIQDFGWHALIEDTGKILIGDPVNIIQHPHGNNKSLVVHESLLGITAIILTLKATSILKY
jgi:endonuclease G, mitochondrial